MKENTINDFEVGETIFVTKEADHVWTGYYTIVSKSINFIRVYNEKLGGVGGFYPNEIRKLTKLEKALK